MSAINSADADATKKIGVWYLTAISGPAMSAYVLHINHWSGSRGDFRSCATISTAHRNIKCSRDNIHSIRQPIRQTCSIDHVPKHMNTGSTDTAKDKIMQFA